MSNPDISVPVSEPVLKATKAIWATAITVTAWVGLLVKSMADGSVTWDEGGDLIGAAVAAAGTIGAVYGVKNKPKNQVVS